EGPMRPVCVSLVGTNGLLPPRGPGGGPMFSAFGRISRGRSAISHASLAGRPRARTRIPDIELLGDDGLDRLFANREHAPSVHIEAELLGLRVADPAKAPRDSARRLANRLRQTFGER